MHTQSIFKLIINANKNAYDITWNNLNDFQEKSEELMKFAINLAPLPIAAKDAASKTIDAYKIIIKQIYDISLLGYENLVRTVTASQKKSGQMPREDYDRTLLQKYPHIILSL
jgi:hypothetical protein